jgi:uncharacterized protein
MKESYLTDDAVKPDVEIRPFRPQRGLQAPLMQTFLGAYLQSTASVTFSQVRVETPDDDFLHLDFPAVEGLPAVGEDAPIVLLLHGMGGSARRGYACELYRQLARAGIRCVGMNYRSCSGEVNRTTRTYHAGATEDVQTVLDWLRRRHPHARLGLVGVSLGANMLLKFLGEERREGVAAAVAISPPFDLRAAARILAGGMGRLYSLPILRSLKQSIRRKSEQLAGIVDLAGVMASRSIYEFDAAYTAPVHGFASVEQYYEQCSAGRFLHGIDTPTLLVRAVDDPFYDPGDIPAGLLAQHKSIQAELPAHGGHVGFAEGPPWRIDWWAQRQAARFLRSHLCAES